MDFVVVRDALREQEEHPMDRRTAERAIGAGLIRWASWCGAVARGEGGAGTIRGETSPRHAARRSQFAELGIQGHGRLWPLVEMIVISRLSQANLHARAIGTLLYHDGLTSSVSVLVRVHAEACLRGVWVATPELDALTALHRAIAEHSEEANAMSSEQRRKLHEETILPLANAAGLLLRSANRGRWRASGSVRPDTRELIRRTAALGEEFTEWACRSYGLQTSAVHTTMQGWGTSLVDAEATSLRRLCLDLLHATAVHHRLEQIFEGWHDWNPDGVMEGARLASVSSLSVALLRAVRLDAAQRPGPENH